MPEYIEYRDEAKRLRRVRNGRALYVCDWSGREHTEYLIPFPVVNLEEKTIKKIWIDEETKRMFFREIKASLKRALLPNVVIRFLLGLIQRKIEDKL